jgi:hypothetical protein
VYYRYLGLGNYRYLGLSNYRYLGLGNYRYLGLGNYTYQDTPWVHAADAELLVQVLYKMPPIHMPHNAFTGCQDLQQDYCDM